MNKPMDFMFENYNTGNESTAEILTVCESDSDIQNQVDSESQSEQKSPISPGNQPEKQCTAPSPRPVHVTINDDTYDERREAMLKYTLRFILITMFVGAFYYFGIRRVNQHLEQAVAMEEQTRQTTVVEPEPVGKTEKGLITGILYSENNPVVVIDNEILKVGESIYGVTVVNIMPDKVEFRKGDKTWTQIVRQEPPAYW